MLQQIAPKTAAAVKKPVAGETSPFQVERFNESKFLTEYMTYLGLARM
jgi:hypothetical protein